MSYSLNTEAIDEIYFAIIYNYIQVDFRWNLHSVQDYQEVQSCIIEILIVHSFANIHEEISYKLLIA